MCQDVHVVSVAIGSDLEVAIWSIGELVACCAVKVTKDLFDSKAVSRLWVRHKLCDLLDGVSDIGLHHDCGVHQGTTSIVLWC